MRLRRTLALAAIATALSVALPALAYSGPRLLSAAAAPVAKAVEAHIAAHHAAGSDSARASAADTTDATAADSDSNRAAADNPTTADPNTAHDPARTWTWPLTPPPGSRRPVIVHRFQPPAKRWQTGHRGVDLLGGPGQEVLAAGQGTVSYAGVLFGRPVVAIDHTAPGRDTLRTTYEPVDPTVRVGEKVRAGQLIGHLVDSPANHCAPQTCLHWGLVRGFGHAERYLDPAALLERGPVRLLPVWGVR